MFVRVIPKEGGTGCQAVLSIERQERKSRRRKIQMYVWRIKVDREYNIMSCSVEASAISN